MTDLLIIGGGMAGLTAALYALRAGKSVLIVEKETFGGQITSAPRVENYPALPDVSGNALADALLSQVLTLGGEIELEEIVGLTVMDGLVRAQAARRVFEARAAILATGAHHRPLGLTEEAWYLGRGVSYCAVCDGAFYKGRDVAVVGGGSSAASAALFLSDLCRTVTLIHRREGFRCDDRALAALRARPNVRFVLNAAVTALQGAEALPAVTLADTRTGETRELPVDGLFVCIGQEPSSGPFADLLPLDDGGFFAVGEDCATRLAGVFVAGDCRAKTVRQLTTAVGDGSVAALAACAYMDAVKG